VPAMPKKLLASFGRAFLMPYPGQLVATDSPQRRKIALISGRSVRGLLRSMQMRVAPQERSGNKADAKHDHQRQSRRNVTHRASHECSPSVVDAEEKGRSLRGEALSETAAHRLPNRLEPAVHRK